MRVVAIFILILFTFLFFQERKVELYNDCFYDNEKYNKEIKYFFNNLVFNDWLNNYSPSHSLSKQELIELSSQLWQEMVWIRDAEVFFKKKGEKVCYEKETAKIFLSEKYKVRADYFYKASHFIRIINSYEYISHNINILDSKVLSLEKLSKDMRDYVQLNH